VGDVVVGDIMYSISQGIVQMGKDRMQTVLKERTDLAERNVETAYHRPSCRWGKTGCKQFCRTELIMPNGMLRQRLDGFIGKYVLYYGVLFFNFNPRHDICSLCS